MLIFISALKSLLDLVGNGDDDVSAVEALGCDCACACACACDCECECDAGLNVCNRLPVAEHATWALTARTMSRNCVSRTSSCKKPACRANRTERSTSSFTPASVAASFFPSAPLTSCLDPAEEEAAARGLSSLCRCTGSVDPPCRILRSDFVTWVEPIDSRRCCSLTAATSAECGPTEERERAAMRGLGERARECENEEMHK